MHMRVSFRSVTVEVFAAVVLCCFALQPVIAMPQEAAAKVEDPREVRGRSLLGVALGVDGAMGADLALRLLETGQLPTAALRREACDIVRARMRDASEPCPVEFVDGRHIACSDCREWLRYVGLSTLPVDALSLRSRLAKQLLGLDAKEALELLLELPPGLDLPKAGCREVLIAMPDVYFRSLREVLPAGTSVRERREGRHWEIASRYVGGVATVSSIGPAADLIVSLGAPQTVTEPLAAELADALDRLEASSREVFHLGERKRGVEAIIALCDRLGTSSPVQKRLQESLRALVLRSLAAPRCVDVSKESMPEIATYFNEKLFNDHPITRDDVITPPTGEGASVSDGWTSTASRRLLTDFQILNTARREMEPGTDMTAWKLEYGKYASRIRSWSSIDEVDDFDYIAQKTSLVAGLISLAPDDATRLESIRDFVVMIQHAKRASTPPHLLLSHASVTLSRISAADRKTVLEMFKSGPGLLSAYATFQLEGIDVFRIERSLA